MGTNEKPLMFSIDEIDPTLKPAALMRVTLNPEAIEEYATRLDDLPHVKLTYDPTTSTHWVDDGAHTISAAIKAGRRDVKAVIKTGSYLDSFQRACHSNTDHGVRVTNADKQKRVQIALSFPEVAEWSSRRIAEWCGVANHTVEKQRSEQLGNFPSSATRVGKDGKARKPRKPREPRQLGGEPDDNGDDKPHKPLEGQCEFDFYAYQDAAVEAVISIFERCPPEGKWSLKTEIDQTTEALSRDFPERNIKIVSLA